MGHKGSPKAEGVLGFVFLNNIPFLGEAARAAGDRWVFPPQALCEVV